MKKVANEAIVETVFSEKKATKDFYTRQAIEKFEHQLNEKQGTPEKRNEI